MNDFDLDEEIRKIIAGINLETKYDDEDVIPSDEDIKEWMDPEKSKVRDFDEEYINSRTRIIMIHDNLDASYETKIAQEKLKFMLETKENLGEKIRKQCVSKLENFPNDVNKNRNKDSLVEGYTSYEDIPYEEKILKAA